jgi:carbon storage regulator
MLVLSRKAGEDILVGSEIRITVIKADRNSVRIGIEAPARIRIDRTELLGMGHRLGSRRRPLRRLGSAA